jgi:uncharacterized protein
MKWTPGNMSRNVEDRRGMRMGPGGFGIGGGLILLVLSLVFGRNFFEEAGPLTTQESSGEVAPVNESAEEKERRLFVSFVLDDVQAYWAQELPKHNAQYQDAKLVLFRDAVQSGCGVAQSASGPFYCPLDQKAYIDLGFYDELQQKFGANGDFAQAYVLAHELGHHVQNLLGTAGRVRQMQEQRPGAANDLSVRLELQADCYAGVWGHSTNQRQILDKGDPEEALNAASAIGDDRIQSEMTGQVRPESFTHGSSQQRLNWFKRGFTSGDPRNCDTFAGAI